MMDLSTKFNLEVDRPDKSKVKASLDLSLGDKLPALALLGVVLVIIVGLALLIAFPHQAANILKFFGMFFKYTSRPDMA